MTTEKKRYLHVTMPDGSVWAVDVVHIAANRAAYFHKEHADEFPTLEAAIADTEIEFADDYYVKDWAGSNMNWRDIAEHAVKVQDRAPMTPRDFQEGWLNGECEIVVR